MSLKNITDYAEDTERKQTELASPLQDSWALLLLSYKQCLVPEGDEASRTVEGYAPRRNDAKAKSPSYKPREICSAETLAIDFGHLMAGLLMKRFQHDKSLQSEAARSEQLNEALGKAQGHNWPFQ